MKPNDAQGKEWIKAHSLPGHEEEVHQWVMTLWSSGWLYLYKVLEMGSTDREGGEINLGLMEYVVDWINYLIVLAKGEKNEWIEQQCNRYLKGIASVQEFDNVTAPVCKDVVSEVVKLADQIRLQRLPPIPPENLVKYVAYKNIEQLCEQSGTVVPQVVYKELVQLSVALEANKDTAWAIECIDKSANYLTTLPRPLRVSVILNLPKTIPGVPVTPVRVLLVVYDGLGNRRPNGDIARILNVTGLVTKHDQDAANPKFNFLTPGNIDRIVSPVHGELRKQTKLSLMRSISALTESAQVEVRKFLDQLARKSRKLAQPIRDELATTVDFVHAVIQASCNTLIPERKRRLFGKHLGLLAKEITVRVDLPSPPTQNGIRQ